MHVEVTIIETPAAVTQHGGREGGDKLAVWPESVLSVVAAVTHTAPPPAGQTDRQASIPRTSLASPPHSNEARRMIHGLAGQVMSMFLGGKSMSGGVC